MGTRNLTMVILNNQTKVAQYGQWDGYPAGQGATVVEFLRKANIDKLKTNILKCRFLSEEEIDARYKALGITGDFMSMEQSANFKASNPQLNRDMAAEVLEEIYNGNVYELWDNSAFANDSLFCEWAYVVDLDKMELEVYTGFNKQPLTEKDRFFPLQGDVSRIEDTYFPIKLLKSFDINNLPTEDDFIKECEPVEEEEPED